MPPPEPAQPPAVTCLRPCYAFQRGRGGVMVCVDCRNPKGSGHLALVPYPGDEDGEYAD